MIKQKQLFFVEIVVGGVAASIVALAVLTLLEFPLKPILALIMFVLTFSLCDYLCFKGKYSSARVSLSGFLARILSYHDYIVLFYYALSLATCLLPATRQTLYVNFGQIPVGDWLRLVAAISLGCFLPGYAIIRIMDKNRTMNAVGRFLFSFFVSIFFTALMSFIVISIGEVFDKSIYTLTLFNIIILTLYAISIFKRRKKSNEEKDIAAKIYRIDIGGTIIVLSTIILICLALYYGFSTNDVFLKGDMFTVFKSSNFVFNNGLTNTKLLINNSLYYPYWFHLLLASLFGLSNFPPINLYLALFWTNAISVLAFYLMASAVFRRYDHRVPKVATLIWGTFSGFSWVYVAFLKVQFQKPILDLYSIMLNSCSKDFFMLVYPYGFNMGEVVPAYLTASVVFLLVYLMIDDRLPVSLQCFLSATLIALSSLLHGEETVVFLFFFLPAFLVFFKSINLQRMRINLFSMVLGLGIVVLIDLAAPRRSYTVTQPVYLFILYLLTIFAWILIRGKIRIKVSGRLRAFCAHIRMPSKMKISIIFSLLCTYCLSFVVLYQVFPEFESIDVQAAGLVPWYFYPYLMGTAGALFIVGIGYYWLKGQISSEIKYLIAIVALIVIVGKMISLGLLPTWIPTGGIFERRLLRWLFVPIAMFAGLVMTSLFSNFEYNAKKYKMSHFMKTLITCSLIAMVVISGSLSSLLAADYWSWSGGRGASKGYTTSEEIEMVNFLDRNTPASSWMITFSQKMYWLAQLSGRLTLAENWLLFDAAHPKAVFDLLSGLGHQSYICLSSSELHGSTYFVKHNFTRYFPVVFNNSEVTVFRVPTLAPPTYSDLKLVDYSSPTNSPPTPSEYVIDILALSETKYQLMSTADNGIFNSSVLILPMDYIDPSTQSLNGYLQWVDSGGHLIIMNSLDSFGPFAKFFSISTNGAVQVDGIQTDTGFLPFGCKMNVSKEYSTDPDVTTIANFTLNNQSTSPYAYSKKIGAGTVVYVDIKGYLSKLLYDSENTRELYAQLGSLIDILDLQLPKYLAPNDFYLENTLPVRGGVNMTGNISIESNFLSINNVGIDWLDLSLAKEILVDGIPRNDFNIKLNTIENFRYQTNGPTIYEFTTASAQVDGGENDYFPVNFEQGLTCTVHLSENSTTDIVTGLQLANGAFETGDKTGWKYAGAGGSWDVQGINKYDGMLAAKVDVNANKAYWLQGTTLFSVHPNQTVEFTAAIKADANINETLPYLEWYTTQKEAYNYNYITNYGGNYDWKYVNGSFVVPDDPRVAYCKFGVEWRAGVSNGTAYLDSVSANTKQETPSIVIHGGIIKFKVSNSTFSALARNPVLSVQGNVSLKDAFSSYTYSVVDRNLLKSGTIPLVYEIDAGTVSGRMNFTLHTGDTYLLLSNLSIAGVFNSEAASLSSSAIALPKARVWEYKNFPEIPFYLLIGLNLGCIFTITVEKWLKRRSLASERKKSLRHNENL